MDRSKFIGGSDVAVVMGLSPFKSAHRLWLEKTGQVEQEDISELFHVIRGVDNEGVALMTLEEKIGQRFESNKRYLHENSYMSCEVDGVNENAIVEIKCMGQSNHNLAEQGTLPDYYVPQLQWNMMLSGMPLCHFASYRPEDDSIHIIDVRADKKYQAKLFKEVEKFWNDNVLGGEEPELSELDYADIEQEQGFKQLAEKYVACVDRKKEVELTLSEVKEELNKLLELKSITRARGCGLILNKYSRKGNVDYKKIPELQGVDLEMYRAKDISVFDVRKGKK